VQVAYNRSKGGCNTEVPLAPFKLSARPWVVPGSSKIRLTMTMPEKEAVIVLDGSTHTISMNMM
jgi:NAD+ kinase